MANQTPETEPKRKSARPAPRIHEVKFVTYPKLLFAWPLILAGLVLWPFGYPPAAPAAAPPGSTAAAPVQPDESPDAAERLHRQDAGATEAEGQGTSPASVTCDRLEILAWIYIWVGFVVLLTLGVDVDRNQAVFWLVLIGGVWIFGMWLQDRNYTIVGDIYRWFAGLDVQYNRSFGLALSVLLLVPYLIMLGYAWLNDRWRITHNEFEHYSFGKMDDSLGRGAKTIRSTFPDVLELLLGMAGTLIVFNATGTKELRRIPHVMFLPFVRSKLNRILERTAITGMMAADEEEDDEDM